MKQHTAYLAVVLTCICALSATGAEDRVIKEGALIGAHLGEDAPMIRTYGRPSQLLDSPKGVPGYSEVLMWKVGDGVLILEISFSAGIINNIRYAVGDSEGQHRTVLTVKEFNPVTGEMIIIIPNKRFEAKQRKEEIMDWKSKVPACFGDKDKVFGDHPEDDIRARDMLKDAIDSKATMSKILAEAESYLKSAGCSQDHIDEQLDKIRNLDF